MERAKRLERDGQDSQEANASNKCASAVPCVAPGDAPERKVPQESAPEDASLSRIATNDDADLREVIAAWTELNPKLRAAILAIVRVC